MRVMRMVNEGFKSIAEHYGLEAQMRQMQEGGNG